MTAPIDDPEPMTAADLRRLWRRPATDPPESQTRTERQRFVMYRTYRGWRPLSGSEPTAG